jgi:hypothetical protein
MATYPLSEAFVDGDVLSASDVNSTNEGVNDLAIAVANAQTGTSYTLALTDVAKVVKLTNASAITLTVPPNSSVAFPTGTQILLYQGGAGQVTITAGAGVTINSSGSKLKLTNQYSIAGILKLDTDEWVAFGNLATWSSLELPLLASQPEHLRRSNTLSSLEAVAVVAVTPAAVVLAAIERQQVWPSRRERRLRLRSAVEEQAPLTPATRVGPEATAYSAPSHQTVVAAVARPITEPAAMAALAVVDRSETSPAHRQQAKATKVATAHQADLITVVAVAVVQVAQEATAQARPVATEAQAPARQSRARPSLEAAVAAAVRLVEAEPKAQAVPAAAVLEVSTR